MIEEPTYQSLAALQKDLRLFASERNWEKFHTPKNLAMALLAEAGELLAEFQWLTPEQSECLSVEQRARVSDEIADVLIYMVRLADVLQVDLLEAAAVKVKRNNQRFPVD